MSDTVDFTNQGVLVTGGAGFIGSHLVDALLARGARVRVLDDLATGGLENLADCLARIELVQGDIRDPATCSSACEGVSYVFHQAALGSVPRSIVDPARTISVNVAGTATVFAAARAAHVRRVIYASSSSVYGDSELLPRREGEEGRPLSPYALSKVMTEQLAETFARCDGMELVGLRYFNVYGPRQNPDGPYAAVIPRFFRAFLEDAAPVIYGDGTQSRDFTYVADAVAANLFAAGAHNPACRNSYNVATGRCTTIRELAGAVREAVGSGLDPSYAPTRPGDVRGSFADLTLCRTEIGYMPQWELAAGLSRSRQYYIDIFASAKRAPAGVAAASRLA